MVKRASFWLLLVIVVFAGAWLLGEILLRVSGVWIGRHSDEMFLLMRHDDTVGWTMKPNLATRYDFVDVERIPVRSNSLGFADAEFTPTPPRDGCRIALLGDSFTWGAGVEEKQRFGNLLRDRSPGRETLNFGIPAYGTDQELLTWERVARSFSPRVVVLTIFGNDYSDNFFSIEYGLHKPYFEETANGALELRGLPVRPSTFRQDGVYFQVAPPYASLSATPTVHRSPTLHWLIKNSEVVRGLYTAYREIRTRGQSPTAAASDAGSLSKEELAQVDLLGRLVARLAGEVNETKARFVVMLAGDPSAMFTRQIERFEASGISWIDARSDRLAAILGPGTPVMFRHNGHWTPEGHDGAARVLAEAIRDRGLCAPPE